MSVGLTVCFDKVVAATVYAQTGRMYNSALTPPPPPPLPFPLPSPPPTPLHFSPLSPPPPLLAEPLSGA